MGTPILKQFAAWVTALPRRYKNDVFFQTALKVAGLEVLIVIFSLGFFAAGIFLLGTAVLIPLFLITVGFALLLGILLSTVAMRPARSALDLQKIFISNIAHELRTPLAIIRTISEVEMLENNLPAQYKKALQEILQEIMRASGVINNALSLNRLLRPPKTEQLPVDLAEIIDRVTARAGRVSFERGIEVLIHKSPEAKAVPGNPVALEQLVINLTNNALQYTQKNGRGRVTISLRPDPEEHGMTMFSVADNGIGIAAEDLPHILEPFYKGDKSRARNIKEGSSGLGLAIVHEIVRAHGGTIRVSSTQGKGTTVTVRLPTAS